VAASPLFPNSAPQSFVGIARLAAEGHSVGAGHEIEYFSLAARSLLNRCTSPRMPFTWTINPYRGCEFACKYCYARYTHEFMEMRDGVDFERKIYVKQNAAWLLRRDLKKVKLGESIALGTATDPYQPAERRYGATRAILEEFARHRGFELGIVTKSTMIERDVDVLLEVHKHNQLDINITVTTANTRLARILEPRAPRPDLRLRTVARLAEHGLSVGVTCAPILPGITDAPRSLEALVKAAAEAGAQWIYPNPLFLKPCSEKIFMPFLEKEFPELVENYRERYRSTAFVSKSYRERISALMRKLREKYKLGERYARERRERAAQICEAEQLALF
jgi:DNA repair photolyase